MQKQQPYKLLFLLVCGICLQTKYAHAQDPHFSQYFGSPLTFNPAFTGFFDASQRFTVNYRSQWSGSDAYTTGTVSFDTRIMRGKTSDNNRWGLGVHALYDQSSGGVLKNTYLSVSTAFNKGLDEEGNQSIGIGVQGTIARSQVDFSRVSFNDQFNGSGFDLTIPSGETMNNRSVSYIDLNAGLLYHYKDESENQFSFGASIYHILQPQVSFFSGNSQSLDRRYVLHGSGLLALAENDKFFFSGHMMKQGISTENVIGAAYGFGFGAERNLFTGAWLRVGDAVFPYIGLRVPQFQLGLSYDITNSELRKTKHYASSTELSFIYFFNASGERRKGIPCFF